MALLDEAAHARVDAAVAAAEALSDGEIVTIVAARSDEYHEVAAHGGTVALLATLAALATWPALATGAYHLVAGRWADAPSPGALLTAALLLGAVAFLAVYLLLKRRAWRLALVPAATRTRRVRRRALQLFRVTAEGRTRAATGVLLYLSLDEHRAELIADAAIHARVAPQVWGEAMALLLAGARDGRIADGMADAVTAVGAVLAEHFPRSPGDTNELPDRLIEL